ncbi:SRPBCC family protein [Actinoplanes sp. NPDC026619]|uniref:SRPBCC family protein n=1 Tax=Actinoplanes sp. NPDC026619 TaxID=3155798 RepID=UPI0033D9D432
MPSDTAHPAERINRPAADVYAYVADPRHITDWAPGLGGEVEQIDGEWFVDTPGGQVKVEFAPPNDYGVLDHHVTFPNGDGFDNPLRVVPYGEGSEIVFSVRRTPGVSDADFARDTDAVAADLVRLKKILESS